MIMSVTGGKNTFLQAAMKMSPLYAQKYGFDKLLPFLIDYIKVQVDDFAPIGQEGLTAKVVPCFPL